MNNSDTHDSLGLESTTLAFGGNKVTLTVGDAKAMETALLTYLASVEARQIEDQDYLIAQTRGGPAWIDTDGVIRISAWVLQSRTNSLVLTFRMPSSEEAGVVKNYVASLVREDSWRVVNIATERIRRRRE